MNIKRAYFLTLSVIFLITIGFVSGYMYRELFGPQETNFPILMQAYQILKDNGIKEIPSGPGIEYGMIRGLLQAYGDPYTVFVEPVQHELESNTLQGSFGGIGVELGRDSADRIILYPYQDGPAAVAGVQEGDNLVEINNIPIRPDTSLEEVQALLRGPTGQYIKIVIERQIDSTRHEYRIKRIEFPIPSITWHIDVENSTIGIIKLNVIAASTPDEIVKAVNALTTRGAEAIILDLRDNFGGLLTAGVDTARLFLKEGKVIEQQYRGKGVDSFEIEEPGPFINLPLVILINQHTASSAEIIAGALQVQGRSSLIGTPSMGKDSIQLVFELKDGSSIHVTAAKWWIPGAKSPIGDEGLKPDILVNEEAQILNQDVTIDKAREFLMNLSLP